MQFLAQLSAAVVPILAMAFLAFVAVLCFRLAGYARASKRATEDVRVLETLIADGFSPQDADEAVRSTREEDPLP